LPGVKAYTFTASIPGALTTGDMSFWVDGFSVKGHILPLAQNGIPLGSKGRAAYLAGQLVNGVLELHFTAGDLNVGDVVSSDFVGYAVFSAFSLSTKTIEGSFTQFMHDLSVVGPNKFSIDAMGFTVGGGGLSDVATSWTAGAPPDLLGFKPFLSTSEWYRDVSGAPVDPDSDNIIADLVRDDPGTMLHPDFGSSLFEGNPVGIPYDVVASSVTPMANVTIGPEGYAGESDPGPDNPTDRVPISVPIPADVHIEGGFDHHILLLDKDNYWLYELYHVEHLGDNSWQADQVTLWDLNDNTRRPWTWTSADQAGLSIFAGLVRYDEVKRALPVNGDLGHAIRFTVMPTLEPFIPPATHPGGGNDPTVHSPKMGQRFRLKAAWLSTHLSEFSPQCQVILRTLARYGIILADTGSNLFIQGTRDARWVEDADAGGVAQLLSVPPNAFEVVAHSVEYTRESHPTGSPPSIASFTATPASVSGGGAANLAWNITGASTLIITPGVGPVRGTSTVVHPTATTTYTIFATNEYGRSTRTVTVTVP
jgi:hypothetical protein